MGIMSLSSFIVMGYIICQSSGADVLDMYPMMYKP
jgi:hypothetical protein